MVTHEDIQELRKVFDREYVRIQDCNDIQQANMNKFANDDKRIDLMLAKLDQSNSKITFNNWLTSSLLGVIITGVISYILLG